MKQTKHWLMIAAVLLCSVTRISAEIILTGNYYNGILIDSVSTNEAGTEQGVYTSEVISCSEPFNTITLTCLYNTSRGGGFDDPSGYPFISLAEFYLYDGEGNEIPLTAENFSTNAQEPTEGPIENICDGDRTTFFHSMWSVGAGEHHKLMITLPEGKELKEFKFKYITRWLSRDALVQISISTDKGSVVIPKGSCGENLIYTLSHDGLLDISGSGAMYDDFSFYGKGLITSLAIQESVDSIHRWAFQDCSSLTSIVVDEKNTTYDSRDNCNAIIETNTDKLIIGCSTTQIPNSVKTIDNFAFDGCSGLTSITIPESVTSIYSYAFRNCTGLTSITIPESVTFIGYHVFEGCTGELTLNCNFDYGDIEGSEFTKVTIGENVTSIGVYAFSGSSADFFINCNIPSYSSTSCAFTDCLTSKVTFGSNVTSIGDYAFYNCKNLESLIIPESVIEIGRDAFAGTKWYKNIEDGVVYINSVLYDYKGTMPENTAITVKEGTTTINNSVFSGKKTLTAITLPGSITKIGESAFKGCSNLTSFDIPANAQLTSIGEETFSGCKALTTVVIPAKVTEIGSRAFYNCTGLTSITCCAEVPPTVDNSSRTASFSKVDTSIPLYVPIGSEAAYQAADGWKEFSNIIGVDTSIENLKSESTLPMIYDLSGRRVEDCTKSGIYIINGKKIVIK